MRYERVRTDDADADDNAGEDVELISQRSVGAAANSSGSAAAPAERPAPNTRSLLSGIWGSVIGTGSVDAAPHASARKFAEELKLRYGAIMPALETSSYEEALKRGARENKFVLIYLHSALHGDSDEFLRHTWCTTALQQLCEQAGIVVWAGSVHRPDGYEAAAQLQVAGYPFVGLYSGVAGGSSPSQPRDKYQQVWTHEGLITATELTAQVRRVTSAAQAVQDQIRAREMARDEDRMLREEQERSYAEAMERDAAVERERVEEEARAAAAAREAEAEAAKHAEEQELAAAIELSKELDKAGALEVCRRRIANHPEPEKVSGVEISVLRFTLPSGTKLQRRFNAADPVSLVRDYIVVASAEVLGQPLSSFDLASSFPKRTYNTHDPTSADLNMSLKEAQMYPQAVLFVNEV